MATEINLALRLLGIIGWDSPAVRAALDAGGYVDVCVPNVWERDVNAYLKIPTDAADSLRDGLVAAGWTSELDAVSPNPLPIPRTRYARTELAASEATIQQLEAATGGRRGFV